MGGKGDDYFVLDERSVGSRILDSKGNNSLLLLTDVDLKYNQEGDDLYIHFDENLDYQHDQDIVWLNFFSQEGNSVNGLSTAEIGALGEDPDDCDPCCAHMPETVGALLI